MSYDINFNYSGTDYEFMLAVDTNGQKRWRVQQLFMPPPSLLNHKIDMVILAAPSVRDEGDDVVTTKDIATVMANLRTLIDGNTITLTGYDEQTYYVTFDSKATEINAIKDESGRITQYEISLSCWDLYQA